MEALRMDKNFDETSGKAYIVRLAENCPAVSNVDIYAKIVREKYDVRSLINAARRLSMRRRVTVRAVNSLGLCGADF